MTKENCTGILEVKSTGWRTYDKWKNAEPPLHYQLQFAGLYGLDGFVDGVCWLYIVDRKLLPPFEYEFRP